MKKLLLSLGTVAAIAAPVASVVACGSTSTKTSTVEVPPVKVLTAPGSTLVDVATEIAANFGAKVQNSLATKLTSTQIDAMIAKVKAIGTIKDEKAFRAALAKETPESVKTFKTGPFVTLNNGVTNVETAQKAAGTTDANA